MNICSSQLEYKFSKDRARPVLWTSNKGEITYMKETECVFADILTKYFISWPISPNLKVIMLHMEELCVLETWRLR